jgi:hypothetical protein
MTARTYTPERLARLLAALKERGVPIQRATLAPDGTLDLVLAGGQPADPFDLVDMKR